jgi:hypothetical protein
MKRIDPVTLSVLLEGFKPEQLLTIHIGIGQTESFAAALKKDGIEHEVLTGGICIATPISIIPVKEVLYLPERRALLIELAESLRIRANRGIMYWKGEAVMCARIPTIEEVAEAVGAND